jgi:mono/diheme cytochrome c family protein
MVDCKPPGTISSHLTHSDANPSHWVSSCVTTPSAFPVIQMQRFPCLDNACRAVRNTVRAWRAKRGTAWLPIAVGITVAVLSCDAVTADDAKTEAQAAAVEFFEAKIRPVLVKHCYKCHSADSQPLQANLRLDSAPGIKAGGDSGSVIVAGQPEDSLLISALRYESSEMPPMGQLSDNVIRDFENWIAAGAVDPRNDAQPANAVQEIDIEAGRTFWAFQPPQASAFLDAQERELNVTVPDDQRIDLLIERRLADADIEANVPADRRTLLRRLSYDLTGLPPSHDQVETFIADESPDALERRVNELLASPAYGERWARLWLDVARYAEDQAHIVGKNRSLCYPNAWKYRDWVIHSLNADMAYDDFIRMQLAADLIAPDDSDSHVALGFVGLGPKYYRRGDAAVMAEEWEDRVDVISRGLQGLTIACARCHDHKYDPIRTEDYYGLAGVFASTEMFNRPLNDKVDTDKKGAAKKPEDSLHIIRDATVHDLAVMIRGDVNQKGDVVPRGFPAVMCDGSRQEFHDGAGRMELAESIASPANPLTARVIINRVWQQYFGAGLVATPSNFGQLGERPSHPELLDDLAVRFMENGWSLKWLHRQIVLSSAYQRSSKNQSDSYAADPANRLLWRMPRRRLSIEAWRDSVLTAAGVLTHAIGGKSTSPGDVNDTRRTVYAEVSRLELSPLLARFDFPDPNAHSARRSETNTPLQKLFLLNSPFMIQMAKSVADRGQLAEETPSGRIQFVFQTTLQRDADEEELRKAELFLNTHPDEGLPQLAQALLVANEFWFLD